ncbi:hypothetical protein ACLOJK_028753 [Asimina triloba]
MGPPSPLAHLAQMDCCHRHLLPLSSAPVQGADSPSLNAPSLLPTFSSYSGGITTLIAGLLVLDGSGNAAMLMSSWLDLLSLITPAGDRLDACCDFGRPWLLVIGAGREEEEDATAGWPDQRGMKLLTTIDGFVGSTVEMTPSKKMVGAPLLAGRIEEGRSCLLQQMGSSVGEEDGVAVECCCRSCRCRLDRRWR